MIKEEATKSGRCGAVSEVELPGFGDGLDMGCEKRVREVGASESSCPSGMSSHVLRVLDRNLVKLPALDPTSPSPAMSMPLT